MCEPDRTVKDPYYQGIRRIYGIQDPGSGRELQHEEVQIRELYYEVRKILYPGSLLQCSGSGNPASCDQPDHGQPGSLEHLDHPCSDLPGNQLSLCAGHFYSFELLRRNRCGKCLRHFGEGIQLSGSNV